MERVAGIGPASHPWEGRVLPLNYTRLLGNILSNQPVIVKKTAHQRRAIILAVFENSQNIYSGFFAVYSTPPAAKINMSSNIPLTTELHVALALSAKPSTHGDATSHMAIRIFIIFILV